MGELPCRRCGAHLRIKAGCDSRARLIEGS